MKVVSWFSAGVSSAVATKIALNKYPDMKIIYTHIDDQHPDTIRFLVECQTWFGKEITILKSKLLTVENACMSTGFLVGPHGAKCTQILKRRVRKDFERFERPELYIWGMDSSKREQGRAERIKEDMPEFEHEFPLIDHGISKEIAHGMMAAAGIKRPAMYDLGYPNNNCIGCLKGGAGYWNKIRVDFPEVFAARSKLERIIGASCIRVQIPGTKKKRSVFLDELDPEAGRDVPIVLEDCGIFCEIPDGGNQ